MLGPLIEALEVAKQEMARVTQLWMQLVIEARSDAVRTILHRNLEC